MKKDEALKKTVHYRCTKCGKISPLSEYQCIKCGAILGIYGDVVESEVEEKSSSTPTPPSPPSPPPPPPPEPKPPKKKKSRGRKAGVIDMEPIVPQKKKKAKSKRVFVSILLIVSLIANVMLGIGLYFMSEEAEWYSKKYWDMYSDYYDMKDISDFYDDYARVVPNDDSGKYHRYGCSKLDTSRFFIYNVTEAKKHASPCQSCCSDDD